MRIAYKNKRSSLPYKCGIYNEGFIESNDLKHLFVRIGQVNLLQIHLLLIKLLVFVNLIYFIYIIRAIYYPLFQGQSCLFLGVKYVVV